METSDRIRLQAQERELEERVKAAEQAERYEQRIAELTAELDEARADKARAISAFEHAMREVRFRSAEAEVTRNSVEGLRAMLGEPASTQVPQVDAPGAEGMSGVVFHGVGKAEAAQASALGTVVSPSSTLLRLSSATKPPRTATRIAHSSLVLRKHATLESSKKKTRRTRKTITRPLAAGAGASAAVMVLEDRGSDFYAAAKMRRVQQF